MTTTNKYIKLGGLAIARPLFELVKNDISPSTGVDNEKFWSSFEEIVRDFQPKNSELLARRDQLQKKIDEWHQKHCDEKHDAKAYKKFLQDIGYLVDEPDDFKITTTNVDTEIAEVAGPQLVVPLDNARYVLNATNARWGSLYDAFYATNAISEADGCKKIKKYNPIRGERVIEIAREFLDRHFALERNTHKHVTRYFIKNNQLSIQMGNGTETTLLKPQ